MVPSICEYLRRAATEPRVRQPGAISGRGYYNANVEYRQVDVPCEFIFHHAELSRFLSLIPSSSSSSSSSSSPAMDTITPTPHLGKFRYLTRGAKPAPSKEAHLLPSLSEFGDVVTLPLTDMKPSLDLGDESPYKLSVHGFTARRHHSSLHAAPYDRTSWNNEHLLREIYFSKVQALVQKLTGCKKAVVSAAVVRNQ